MSHISTRIEVVRAPESGLLLDFATLGEHLPPSARRPAFRQAEYRRGVVLEDGAVLAVEFESLRPKQ